MFCFVYSTKDNKCQSFGVIYSTILTFCQFNVILDTVLRYRRTHIENDLVDSVALTPYRVASTLY